MSRSVLARLPSHPRHSVTEASALFPRSDAWVKNGLSLGWFHRPDGTLVRGSKDNPWGMTLLSDQDIIDIARSSFQYRRLSKGELREVVERLLTLTQK